MLGILALVASGARAGARNRSRAEFQRTYRDLVAAETPSWVSSTAPVRQRLIDDLYAALSAAAPEGWTVHRKDDLFEVRCAHGPQLLVEVEPPGCISRRGRCDERVGRAVPAYWLIAPAGPRITVLALTGGTYVEQAGHTGEVFAASEPFSVTVPLQVC